MRDKGGNQPAQSRYPTGVMVITTLQKYNIQVFSNKMEHFPVVQKHWEYLPNATNPARKFSSCKYYCMHEIFIKPTAARMITKIKPKHTNEPQGVHKPNNREFEFKQNYRTQSSSSHIPYKAVYQHPKRLVQMTSILKFKVQIRLQVQGFDYQHNSKSQKIVSVNPLNAELNPTCHLLALLRAHNILHVSRIRVNCTAKMVNTKICRISTLHEAQKPNLVHCFSHLCDCQDHQCAQTRKA